MTKKLNESDHIAITRAAVLEAALPNVMFDGWSEEALKLGIAGAAVDPGLARQAFPRGAVDLAMAFHMDGDAELARCLEAEDLSALRYSERVARAICIRLEIASAHKEAVRRGVSFFALPMHSADGARAIWHTADVIWNGLGDSSGDVNWYTKRMTLSAVYSSSVLFWLGDDDLDMTATKAFVDRRIENVMQFEKLKARFRDNPLGKAFAAGPGRLLDAIKAPGQSAPNDLPGRWRT